MIQLFADMLLIEDACIAFRERPLFSHFNLHLSPGEMASISGPSGCGKSSLLNAVLGFLPLKEGRIVVQGLPLNRNTVDQIRKMTAWIPQDLSLPHEWVKDMIQLPFSLKANRQVIFSERQLFESFEELGLELELYDKRVNQISGGQRQRIMIAVAAMLRKPLLVADEPTSALDAISGERVLKFLKKQAATGTAILAVSHDEAFSAGCEQQIRMNDASC